ncbi:MAG: BatD family protein [Myxococcota bacterium]
MKSRTWMATLFSAVLLASSASVAADLETHLDRDRIGPGESIELTLRLRGGSPADEPDLRPLLDDFEVIDVGTSFRTHSVNGQRDASVDWRITLLPLRTGSIEVPSLRVGNRVSVPREIQVVERSMAHAAAATANAGPPAFLEAEIDTPDPYVQGEVTLTVRLHADDRVLDGTLTEPSVGDAIVERVGEDRNYRTRVGDREYAVIERTWSIFPQRSGPLEISPVLFQGTVREEERRAAHDPFDDFFGGSRLRGSLFDDFFGPRGQPIRVRSAALSLDVRPKPDTAQGQWWVPARDVVLIELWESDPPVFKVGEPVNRLVAIQAAGISVSQLPDLELPDVEGLKQYSEPSVEETIAVGNEVVAVKARQTALIPTRPGPLVLPAVELEWWDTVADAPRTATLPERTVEVEGGSGLAGVGPATPAGATPVAPTGAPEPEVPVAVPALLDSGIAAGTLAGLALAATAGLGWGLVRWRAAKDSRPETSPGPGLEAVRLKDAERDLQQACDNGDPGTALGLLATIGRLRWPEAPPLNAGDWARRLGSSEFRQAVKDLHRVRYSQQPDAWNGGELWQAYSKIKRSKHPGRRRNRGPLPGLYPTVASEQSPA